MPTTTKSQQPAEQAQAARPSEGHEQVPVPLGGRTGVSVGGAAFSTPPDGLDGLQDAAGNRAVAAALESLGGALVQRKCAECASGGATCARCAAEDEMIRRSATPGAPGATAALPAPVTAALGAASGRSLGGETRAFMESRFGQPFGHVRVHTDETAAQAADAIGASAFTVGNSIWFGRGMYQPDAAGGLHLLAHELTHTVQQRGRASTAQPSLRVGPTNDAAESTADRVADAVLAGRPLSRIGAGGLVVRRKPKVTPVASDPARRIVEMDDGKRYRVKRNVEWVERKRKVSGASTKFGGDIDTDNVWIQIDHCEKTGRVTVKIGANVPAVAQDVLKKAGQAILNGTPPGTALQGIKIEPFVSVIVAESKKYRVEITGKPTVDVEKGQITGGSTGITAKVPGADITLEGKLEQAPPGQRGPNVSGGIKITIPLEKTPPKVECPTFERTSREPRITYGCEEIIPEHEVEKQRPITLRRSHYLYFEYAKSEFARKGRTATLDKQSKSAVKGSLDDGYRVNAIRGYASPEGPMEPTKRFQGNQKLSEERAEAAERWLNEFCPPPSLLSMRPGCFAEDYSQTGKGELYGASPAGKELKGKELAETAVEAFKTEEAEERGRTPEVKEELEKRKTPERQTDTVYPLLRRAEIDLSKAGTETYKETVPETNKPLEGCPADVLRAAEGDFEQEPPVQK